MRSHKALLSVPLLACAVSSVAKATLVFTKTFTSGPNGVVQFETGGGNNMIGTVVNNQLPITTVDNGTNAYTPDKAGEPLGTTVTGMNAFSGLYNFNWSNLNTNDESNLSYELVGFLGTAVPQTRQVMGVILRHWYLPASEASSSDSVGYYVGLDLAFGSVGITDFGYNGSTPAIYIGPNSPTAAMQLAIGFDPTTNTLSAGLYDTSGNALGTHSSVISRAGGMYGTHPPSYDSDANIQSELNDLSASYLGWEDYTGNGNDIPTTWNMNSISYYNDATGAFTAATIQPSLSWNNTGGTGDGSTWDTTSQNWNNGSPATYTDGNNVVFNDTNNGNYSVTLNSTVSPGSVVFSNSLGNYVIGGTGSISGAGSLTMSGTGTTTLNTVNTYSGGTNVSSGVLVVGVNGAFPNGKLAVSGTGTLRLGTSTGLATVSSLTIINSGIVDVNNNHMIIDYTGTSPIATIASEIATGYAAGAWNGVGIDSSAAATHTGYALGYADGADGVVANLSAGQIEVAYVLYGDVNLDGVVNGTDFGIFAANFGKSVNGWDQGDFNFDNVANGSDFGLLASNFGKSASGAALSLPASEWTALESFASANGLLADVPEPASLGLLTLGAIGVLTRRRARSDA